MVYKCCVPFCKGNYDSEEVRVPIFRFPNEEELRQKWISAIPRQNFIPTVHSRVCSKHFVSSDIIHETSVYDEKSGRCLIAPLKSPQIRSGAIPTIFPGCPSYMTSSISHRDSPENKRRKREMSRLQRSIELSVQACEQHKKERTFNNLNELLELIKKHVNIEGFYFEITADELILFNLTRKNDIPVIDFVIAIDLTFTLTISKEICKLNKWDGQNLPLENVELHVIEKIVSKIRLLQTTSSLENSTTEKQTVANKVTLVTEILESLREINEKTVDFLIEQTRLLTKPKNSLRYSSKSLINFALIYTISPHAYKFMRSSECFVMPHPSTIADVSSTCDFNPAHDSPNFLKYAKKVFSTLDANDVTVSLLMDEIHIKPYLDFKGGTLVGNAQDSKELATSAYTFMISSIRSNFKEVVHIEPVKTFSAHKLYLLVQNIVVKLELIGYNVVSVISDNNAINKKAMSLFSTPPQLSIVYPHPVNSSRPLFFMFDSVHILKCIRNNWLNEKSGQIFIYPPFEPESKATVSRASFSTLRKLHDLESNLIIKYCPTLSLRSLYPSNLERQNVKLVLQVFNQFCVQGLKTLGQNHESEGSEDTAEFLEIIINWWSVVNVKTPFKGVRLKNLMENPLTSNSPGMNYLEKICDWLERWEMLEGPCGKLSKETFTSFKHTSYALVEFTKYCINELGLKYVLPGKLQTDNLEARFGQYRRLAGSNYNVTLRQVFENENKIRLQNNVSLCVRSKKYEDVQITDFEVERIDETESFHENVGIEVEVGDKDFEECKNMLPVLTYIAGYCCQSLIKNNSCESCKSIFVREESLAMLESYELIKSLTRGGLLFPNECAINAVCYSYIVFNKIVSTDLEIKFLNCREQRGVLKQIILNCLITSDHLQEFYCQNGHSYEKSIKKIVHVASNIFMKNYCKKIIEVNTRNCTSKKQANKKLSTFNK